MKPSKEHKKQKFAFKRLYVARSGKPGRNPLLDAQNPPPEAPANDDILKWIRFYFHKEVIGIESKHTARAKAYDLHKLMAFYEFSRGDLSIRSWDKAFTASFIAALEKEYEIASIYRIFATVVNFVNFLILREVIKPVDNPTTGIRLQAKELPPPKGIQLYSTKNGPLASESKEMYGILMSAARSFIASKDPEDKKNRTLPRRDAAIIALLYHTGLRVDEVCNITLSQMERIVGGGMWLRNIKCKANKVRKAYLKEEGVSLLVEYIERERGSAPGYLFQSWRGHKLNTSDIWRIVNKIAVKARESLPPGTIIDVHPHSLRHERAYNLRKAGLGDALIAEQLGHSGLGQVARYSRRSEEDEAEMLKDI